jgi:hydrogenase expression/formation protein HypE
VSIEVTEEATLARIDRARRRPPRLTDTLVTMAHGAGGKASAALTAAVFLPGLGSAGPSELDDAACLTLPCGERIALSTDSFVVTPRRFPGGSIAELAVNGTVNDLAMVGARPLGLTVAFVIEEGLEIDELRGLVAAMGYAAEVAHVRVMTGDTKVVPKGAADGLYITTAGVGVIPAGRLLSSANVRPGDQLLVSGTIGDHGTAVMLARGDLGIEADAVSDTVSLSSLVEALLAAAPGVRWMRDPTRGGVATVCNELAREAGVGILLEEAAFPVRPEVTGVCDLLGIDPLYVANEGKLLAVVAAEEAGPALAALRAHPAGRDAARIGEVVAEPAATVVLQTGFGGSRIVDMLVGDPLPRIC